MLFFYAILVSFSSMLLRNILRIFCAETHYKTYKMQTIFEKNSRFSCKNNFLGKNICECQHF